MMTKGKGGLLGRTVQMKNFPALGGTTCGGRTMQEGKNGVPETFWLSMEVEKSK